MTVAPCVPQLGSWRAKLLLDFKKRGPVPSCFKKVQSKNTKVFNYCKDALLRHMCLQRLRGADPPQVKGQ